MGLVFLLWTALIAAELHAVHDHVDLSSVTASDVDVASSIQLHFPQLQSEASSQHKILQASFSAFNTSFRFELVENTQIFSPDAWITIHSEGGVRTKVRPPQGIAFMEPSLSDPIARLTLIDSKILPTSSHSSATLSSLSHSHRSIPSHALSGYFSYDGYMYLVEPFHVSPQTLQQHLLQSQSTVAFSAAHSVVTRLGRDPGFGLQTESTSEEDTNKSGSSSTSRHLLTVPTLFSPCPTSAKLLKAGILVDVGCTNFYGGSSPMAAAIAAQYNVMNSIKNREMNIYLQVADTIIMTTTGTYSWNGSPNTPGSAGCSGITSAYTQLNNIYDWRRVPNGRTDVGYYSLLTYCWPAGGVIGLSIAASICQKDYSDVSLSSAGSIHWQVQIHELTHVLGWTCDPPTAGCTSSPVYGSFQAGTGNTVMGRMTAISGPGTCNFTATVIASSYNCFTSYPGTCGNGIVEGDEKCDATNKCCSNCQLTAGAQCGQPNECCNLNTCLFNGPVKCMTSYGLGFCDEGYCNARDTCSYIADRNFCATAATQPSSTSITDDGCFQICLPKSMLNSNGTCPDATTPDYLAAYNTNFAIGGYYLTGGQMCSNDPSRTYVYRCVINSAGDAYQCLPTSTLVPPPVSGSGGTTTFCAISSAAPTNGGSGTCGQATTPYPGTCTQTCPSGYTPSSTLTRTCQSNGQLTAGAATCTAPAVTCAISTAAPTNGGSGTCGQAATPYPGTCTQTCPSGYTPSSTLTRTCQSNGQLTAGATTCTAPAVTCAISTTAPTNGGSGTCGTSATPYPGTCTQTCPSGYTPSSTLVRTCQSNGQLTAGATTCTAPVTCPASTAAPTNGGSGNCGQAAISYPGSCTQTCPTGYTPSSTLTRTCQSTGVLTAGATSCNEINECSSGTARCAQNCTNTAGSYTCGCTTGYALAGDGFSCLAVSVNCTGAPNCTTLNRDPCTTTTNTCGSCIVGYRAATTGAGNTQCTAVTCAGDNTTLSGVLPGGCGLTTTFSNVCLQACTSGTVLQSGSLARLCQANGQLNASSAICATQTTQPPSGTINGGWTVWSDCTTSCGGGVKGRTCTNPIPQATGANCSGSWYLPCNTNMCQVNGGWTPWGPCSATCGLGTMMRSCTNPTPSANGLYCPGLQASTCNNPCNSTVVVGGWTVWSDCSKYCGTGSQVRNCTNPEPQNSPTCTGIPTRTCRLRSCPAGVTETFRILMACPAPNDQYILTSLLLKDLSARVALMQSGWANISIVSYTPTVSGNQKDACLVTISIEDTGSLRPSTDTSTPTTVAIGLKSVFALDSTTNEFLINAADGSFDPSISEKVSGGGGGGGGGGSAMGAAIGGAVGGILFVIILVVLIWYFRDRLRECCKRSPSSSASAGKVPATATGGAAASSYAAGATPVWQRLKDDQGNTYYYNTVTGASQWEEPEELRGAGSSPAPSSPLPASPLPGSSPMPLPIGLSSSASPLPGVALAHRAPTIPARPAPPPATTVPSPSSRSPSPPGAAQWQKIWDDQHKAFYYYNGQTDESRWDAPEGYTEQ